MPSFVLRLAVLLVLIAAPLLAYALPRSTGLEVPPPPPPARKKPPAPPAAAPKGEPEPHLSEDASAIELLQAAERSVTNGRTNDARDAMEKAQTRMLDRSVPLFQTNTPSTHPAVGIIGEALRALGKGDRAGCLKLIQAAIAEAHRTP